MLKNLVKLAAEKARDAAEEYFKLQNIDMAIRTLKAAKEFNPDLPNIDDYFTAYRVHQLSETKSTLYKILVITDPQVDISVIKKQFKKMALMLHPDKNSSVAADGAFKLIRSANDVLRDPEKRKAYDNRIRLNKVKLMSCSCCRPQGAGDNNSPRASTYKANNTSCPRKYRAKAIFCQCQGRRKIVILRNC